MVSRNFIFSLPARQSGVVLIVGLIMVLLISIIALASIRGSGLQESMAGNMRDRGMAFQTAEGGVSEAENIVFTKSLICDGVSNAGVKCWMNLDATPSGSVQYFDKTGFTNFGNTSTLNMNVTGSSATVASSYVIEELATFQPDDGSGMDSAGSNPFRVTAYRITSRGPGISSDSQVVIQSTYNLPAN